METVTDMSSADQPADQPDWAGRVLAAQHLIESRLDEDVPLDELARTAHASAFHFHRVFRGMTGETVRGYARRLRLERAAIRLRESDDDILAIALAVGYSSHDAFTRAFRARFGVVPSVYRTTETSHDTRSVPEGNSRMDLEIRTREPATIAFARHTGSYADAGQAWKALMKWGWTRMVFGRPSTFGLCFDDPDVTADGHLRYEACMEVSAKTKPRGPVGVRPIAGGSYAVALHAGPYTQLAETYAALCAQVVSAPVNGRCWTLADPPSLEVYLNDPRKTAPSNLKTEVWMPVAAG